MNSGTLLEQIKGDIQTIRESWISNDSKLELDWYAFNYWVLNYLYHIDIDDIPDCITEYNDKGIDCYVHFEDTKELYIIQNYYYSETSNLKREGVADFLITPLNALISNNYSRSSKLQNIFNFIKSNSEYTVYLYCYVTKTINSISNDIISLFNNASYNYPFNVETKLVDLTGIKQIYEGERFNNSVSFEYDMKITRRDLIEQNSEQHDKENNVDTAYVAINVIEIFKMLEESQKIEYDLFDKNIREYLGIKGTRGKANKEIMATLLDDTERSRFFYYNNGITIICNNFSSNNRSNGKTILKLVQPQIVNGCQTVNTIYNAILSLSEEKSFSEIITMFKHCSILLKIFKVNKNSETERNIYENIVRYTNTQTSISAKDFVSKDDYFLNLQDDFLKRGFYLIVKQSDKRKFEIDGELFKKNQNIVADRISRFSLNVTKPSDLFIDLDKMLKCLLAFYFDGYTAFKSGSSVLNEHSVKYYVNFSKKIRDYYSTDNMINLFLTYKKSGGTKVARTERYPIPYYMMDFLSRYIKRDQYDYSNTNDKLTYLFSTKETFEEVYFKICELIEDYADEFTRQNNVDYSTMTKNREIDINLLDTYMKLKLKDAIRNNWTNFIKYASI